MMITNQVYMPYKLYPYRRDSALITARAASVLDHGAIGARVWNVAPSRSGRGVHVFAKSDSTKREVIHTGLTVCSGYYLIYAHIFKRFKPYSRYIGYTESYSWC
jgi:hypothetical protein